MIEYAVEVTHMTESRLNPNSSKLLEEAVANVIRATMIEEAALSNLLNITSDITQKVKNESASLEEFVSIDKSVNGIIKNSSRVQRVVQVILKHMEELIQKIENDTLEE
jgi:DNA repair ATPase RecN